MAVENMTHWLFPANTKFYDVLAAFAETDTYWPSNAKLAVGDVAYIYLAAPYKQIGFVCDVAEVGLKQNSIMKYIRPFFKGEMDHKKPAKLFMKLKTRETVMLGGETPLDYKHLKQNGLNGMLMGPRKLENNPILLNHIQGNLK